MQVGRGIDIERVNIVINYDMPETDEVGRQGGGGARPAHLLVGDGDGST